VDGHATRRDLHHSLPIHQSLPIPNCAVLNVYPTARINTAKIVADLLAAIKRGERALVVPAVMLTRRAPGADVMNAPFLHLLHEVVRFHNAGGGPSAVRSVMHLLLDASKTSPVHAYLQGHNAGAACHALEALAALAAPETPFSRELFRVMKAVDADGVLPCRFSGALTSVLACTSMPPEQPRKLFLAALDFFGAVCRKVVLLSADVSAPLADGCTSCTTCSDTARAYLVAFRARPSAGRDTPLPIRARAAVLRLLVRDCDERGLQVVPLVEEYGSVMFARGHWVGAAGLLAAREFARSALPVIYGHNIEPWGTPPAATPPAGVNSLYEADVLFDWLDMPRGPDVGRDGLMCFGHPPFRPASCLFHVNRDTSGGAAYCNKVNRLATTIRLGPGCMPISCPHRVCYGFVILDQAESPRYMFQALRQFFPFPPEVVVYDMACALAKYSLARNPSLFRDVLFVIDRFHQVGFCLVFVPVLMNLYLTVNVG
jgi:hypothetical protein